MKVVIIGAGVAGLGIGWKLAKAGASVTVLERAQVGSGAASSSAGMIAATAELGQGDSHEALFAKQANDLWPDFVKELEAQSEVHVGYLRNGSLMVALPTTGRPSHGSGPNPHAQGSDVKLIDAEQARRMEPLLKEEVLGALWMPSEATVDTHALLRALAVALAQAGGALLSNEAGVRIEMEKGRAVGVRTPFTFHRADAIVLAAGAWSSRIEGLPPEAVPPVIPIKGEIVVLTPPVGAQFPQHVVWGNEIYVVPRRNRLLVGATVERAGFDTGTTREAYRWLRRKSAGLMPDLARWELAEHWAGLRPATPDGMPVLGPSVLEGLFVASGQYRNGILYAPAVAEAVSRQVLGEAPAIAAFDPRRFAGGGERARETVMETAHRAPDNDPGAGEWRMGS